MSPANYRSSIAPHLHQHLRMLSFSSFFLHSGYVEIYITVLICIYLMFNNIKHCLMYLLTIQISFFVQCFCLLLFCFCGDLLFSCIILICILDISNFPGLCIISIFFTLWFEYLLFFILWLVVSGSCVKIICLHQDHKDTDSPPPYFLWQATYFRFYIYAYDPYQIHICECFQTNAAFYVFQYPAPFVEKAFFPH